MRTAPVILASDVVSFAAADPAGTVRAPTYGLRNVDAVPIVVEQIGFTLPWDNGIGLLPPMLSVSLRYRNQPITNGWIPIVSFCAMRNEIIEGERNNPVVRLPVPLILYPGEWIDVSFSNPLCGGVQVSAQAFAAGKLGDAERGTTLPYFAAFVGPVQDGNSNALFSFASTPQDLGAPFDFFRVRQLVGRLGGGDTAAGYFLSVLPSNAWQVFTARISDERGTYWVPTPTPLSSLVSVALRMWQMDYQMPRNGFLRVDFEGVATWANGVAGAGYAPRYCFPVVGLVGERPVE